MEFEKYDVEIITGGEFAAEFETEIIDFLNKLECNEIAKKIEENSEDAFLIGAYMTEDGETFVFDYFFVESEEKIRLKFSREEINYFIKSYNKSVIDTNKYGDAIYILKEEIINFFEENEKLYDFDIILTEAISFVGCEKDSSLVLKP